MANKERNKRSARKARAAERAQLESVKAQTNVAAKSSTPKNESKVEKKEKDAPKKRGIFSRLTNYLKEVRNEVRRVVWPSKTELKNYSVAVIGMLIIFGLVIWAVDSGIVALLVGYTGLRG